MQIEAQHNWTGPARRNWTASERHEFVERMDRKLQAKASVRRERRRISLGWWTGKAKPSLAR
jgi:hypothetical protein